MLSSLLVVLIALWFGLGPLFGARPAQAQSSDLIISNLIISEYVDGTANNKALEIYNGTGAPVNLAAYSLELYNNGNGGLPNARVRLAGTLGSGETYVIVNPTAGSTLLQSADLTSNIAWFDGNDALVLKKNETTVDRFGRVGENPGTRWGNDETGTKNSTLRRKFDICTGEGNGRNPFNPSEQWDTYLVDTFNDLGVHTTNCGEEPRPPIPGQAPKINEFVIRHIGTDTHEFIEVLGQPNANYRAFTLVVIDGNADRSPGEIYRTYEVGETDGAGYWTTGFRNQELRNGTNTLLLVRNFRGAVGDDLDDDNLGGLDATPWAAIVDSIAVSRAEAGDHTYAGAVTLFPNFDDNPDVVSGASRIPNGASGDGIRNWLRNHFDGQGLDCANCTGQASFDAAVNTPGRANRRGERTPTTTPTATPTGTPRPVDTSIPDNCRDILINGGFETTEAWKFGEDPVPPRFTSDQRTGGLRSVLLGHPAGSGGRDAASYSSIRQKVMIPAGATVAYVTWNHFSLTEESVQGDAGAHGDRQEFVLLAPNGMTVSVEYRRLLNNSGWNSERRDLTNYIGKNLNLYFNVFNNGNNLRTWMYLDDVRLIVCYPDGVTPGEGFATPTPMPLPTSESTATPTVTPSSTATPTPTSTATARRRVPPVDVDATAVPEQETMVEQPQSNAAAELPDAPAAARRSAPNNCVELVTNGEFEQTGAGWTLVPGENMAAYTREETYNGSAQAMRLGNIDRPNLPSLSIIEQAVQLPTNYASLILSYAYYPRTDGELGPGDLQYIDIYNAYTEQFLERALSARRDARSWLFEQVDVTELAGQPIRLTLAVNNDGVAGRAAMYVDSVSILACEPEAGATPTPTLSAITPPPTPIPTLLSPAPAPTATGVSGSPPPSPPPLLDRLGTIAVLLGILVVITLLIWGILTALNPRNRE